MKRVKNSFAVLNNLFDGGETEIGIDPVIYSMCLTAPFRFE